MTETPRVRFSDDYVRICAVERDITIAEQLDVEWCARWNRNSPNDTLAVARALCSEVGIVPHTDGSRRADILLEFRTVYLARIYGGPILAILVLVVLDVSNLIDTSFDCKRWPRHLRNITALIIVVATLLFSTADGVLTINFLYGFALFGNLAWITIPGLYARVDGKTFDNDLARIVHDVCSRDEDAPLPNVARVSIACCDRLRHQIRVDDLLSEEKAKDAKSRERETLPQLFPTYRTAPVAAFLPNLDLLTSEPGMDLTRQHHCSTVLRSRAGRSRISSSRALARPVHVGGARDSTSHGASACDRLEQSRVGNDPSGYAFACMHEGTSADARPPTLVDNHNVEKAAATHRSHRRELYGYRADAIMDVCERWGLFGSNALVPVLLVACVVFLAGACGYVLLESGLRLTATIVRVLVLFVLASPPILAIELLRYLHSVARLSFSLSQGDRYGSGTATNSIPADVDPFGDKAVLQ